MKSRLLRVLPFLFVFTSVLASFHYVIFVATARDLPASYGMVAVWILTLGLISIPLGLLFSHGRWRKVLKPLTILSYFWLGYFFILFSFSVLNLAVNLFVDVTPSYWPWLAALAAGFWSTWSALSPPRIVNYRLPGPPSIRGITLVQISDVHIGMPFLNENWLRRQGHRFLGATHALAHSVRDRSL